jgi:hypothetical protein
MEITPDSRILFVLPGGPLGDLSVSATIVNTWIVMAILVIGGRIATLGIGPATPTSRWRLAVELLIEMIRNQIRAIGGGDPARYLPFVGTLFLFTLLSNVLGVVPGFISPTGSLSTAVALALCVLVAVPMYGIAETGLFNYLRRYIRPRRDLAHHRACRPSLRQRDEWHGGGRDSTLCRTLFLPGAVTAARPADRRDPSLHLRRSRHGLHRLRERAGTRRRQ